LTGPNGLGGQGGLGGVTSGGSGIDVDGGGSCGQDFRNMNRIRGAATCIRAYFTRLFLYETF